MMLTMYSLGTISVFPSIFHFFLPFLAWMLILYYLIAAVAALWLLDILYLMPQKKRTFRNSKTHGAYLFSLNFCLL